jgi:hypothetical protein
LVDGEDGWFYGVVYDRLFRVRRDGSGFATLRRFESPFENNPRIVQTTELRFHDGAIVGVARWGNGGAQLVRWRP